MSDQERAQLSSRLIAELPALRIKLGLSQDDLASILDISRQTYSSVETGKRKMSWTLYLSLILLFDNNRQTHDIIRSAGLFPQNIFRTAGYGVNDQIFAPLRITNNEDIKNLLDDQALHAIETVIMMEYARCSNMGSEAVIRAFEGRHLVRTTPQDVKAKKALMDLQRKTDTEADEE